MIRLKILDILGRTEINSWYNFFKESEFWTKEQIEVFQLEQLKKLMVHCSENVPYYRDMFPKLNIDVSKITSIDVLQKLPILRKEIVKKAPEEFCADNMEQFKPVKKRTGGSTGVPFEYYNDRRLRSIQWALKFISWNRAGYQVGDRLGVMGGGSLFPKEKKSWKHILRNKLNNFYKFPMTSFSESMVEEYARKIKKNKIHYLRGYPSAISTFARLCKTKELDIKAVFTTAEVLTDEYRRIIEENLNTKVFDQYGCADAGVQASECEEHNGLHLYSTITILDQMVEKNDTARNGELLFTSLFNYSMPLLRYAPEDIAIVSEESCPCERNLTLIKKLQGRTTDIIHLENGKMISGPALTLIFSQVNVEKYQVIQETRSRVLVKVIPSLDFDDKSFKKLQASLELQFGKDISFEIDVVKEIQLPVSGKFRFVVAKQNEQ